MTHAHETERESCPHFTFGGMDSATAFYWALQQNYKILAERVWLKKLVKVSKSLKIEQMAEILNLVSPLISF